MNIEIAITIIIIASLYSIHKEYADRKKLSKLSSKVNSIEKSIDNFNNEISSPPEYAGKAELDYDLSEVKIISSEDHIKSYLAICEFQAEYDKISQKVENGLYGDSVLEDYLAAINSIDDAVKYFHDKNFESKIRKYENISKRQHSRNVEKYSVKSNSNLRQLPNNHDNKLLTA